jgi:chromosome segregation ATPase
MKNIIRIVCFALLSLSIALASNLASAQPQGQVSGVQNPNLNQSQDAAAQIHGMTGAIKDMQQAIEDAVKEMQQMIDDLKQLRAERPTPPKGSNPQEKDAYIKRMTDWKYKITAKEHQIVATQAKINQLQRKLSDLQEQLASLQKDARGYSGNALPPAKVIPKK